MFDRRLINLFLFVVPELVLLTGVVILWFICGARTPLLIDLVPYMLLFLLLFRLGIFIFVSANISKRVETIRDTLDEFKRGRFLTRKKLEGNDELTRILREIRIAGRYVDNLLNSQRREIEKFNEFYNNMVFSMSSYFIVLDENEKVKFANEGFLKKFDFTLDELVGRKIEDIFYFVNARIRGALQRTIVQGETVVLEKIHLLSLKKISIIADVKISSVIVQGRRQIIAIIDDVTNTLRKDYQLSLMSQISRSIHSDKEIDTLLQAILTGVTSGSGLGFNRAMLFLADGEEKFLTGRMAVGPDSFEEAIEIWNAVTMNGGEGISRDEENQRGTRLLESVRNSSFNLSEENVFTFAFRRKEHIQVIDAWNDPQVTSEIREMLDVKEFIVVPLVAVGRPIGILVADNKFNQIPIMKDTIELLMVFASQAALSIESYRNMESTKKDMYRMEQRQEAIVESEKMAAVGRIAAHIAHEIRNPLVTMGGYARRIMQLSKDTRQEEKITDSARIILKESERLEKTLSNVMDFTRPSRQIMEFNSITDIVRDTVELLHNLFMERKIDIELDLNKKVPLVKSDFNQLKQVVLNLLQNSIDAMGKGGVIWIKTDYDESNVYISLEDTGPGIDQPDPSVVFEPFFTTKTTGVGLGLANVKKIIGDHYGDITVENRSEGGARFVITLPVPA